MSRPRESGLIEHRLRLVWRLLSLVRPFRILPLDASDIYDNDEEVDLLRRLPSSALRDEVLYCGIPARSSEGVRERDRLVEMVDTEVEESDDMDFDLFRDPFVTLSSSVFHLRPRSS